MPIPSFATRLRPALLSLAFLAATALPAGAVIMKLTPLAEVLETEDFIFVAGVDRVDPEKPLAVFKVEKNLKEKFPSERIPVNMKGNADAKKAGDTKTILDRLDQSRKVVFFISKRGMRYNAMSFVEGTWFSLIGTQDPTDKTIRWAFQSGEPYLRRTFKGTSAELIKVIEDGLAKKAKPPAPDEKEKPGYGPAASKKCGEADQEARNSPRPAGTGGPTLFGVIPSFVLVGPLAIIAALFPGVFARMAVGMKRWRAFLVIASLESTLALVFFFSQRWLPSGWWFGTRAFTLYLMAITAVGLIWAGRRYRQMAAAEPSITSPPSNTELYALGGLTCFALVCAMLTAAFAGWGANLELPMREFTFIGVSLCGATLYALYRALTPGPDLQEPVQERRLSLSGESVALGTLFLCGMAAVLSGANGSVRSGVQAEAGEAAAIGPRLVNVQVFEVPKASQVLSGITINGDRLYFGAQFTRLSSQEGFVVCMNRDSGEVKWRFGDDDGMKPVFCTPTVANGLVYCGEGLHKDKDCRVFCFKATDGSHAWKTPCQTHSHTEGAPAVIGKQVFVPAGDDGLIALDAETGNETWRFAGGKDRGIHVDAAPAVSGKHIFIGSGLYTYAAVCLDADTHQEVWRTDLKLRAFGAPLALGKHVYYGVGTGNIGADVWEYEEEGSARDKEPAGAIVCLEAETGKEAWRHELPRSVHTALAGDGYSIYAGSRDGFVYALDRGTGQLRWKTSIGSAITSAPAVATAGGLPVGVYAVSREGLLTCLNPHTGKLVWQKQLPGFQWDGQETGGVLSGPAIVSSSTPTGSKRTIYVGAMKVDPDNTSKKTCAVFRFDDEIGGE